MASTLISKVNNVNLPYPPSTCEISWQDISLPNSGRDLTGTMHKDKVAEKVKIVLAWQGSSPEMITAIKKLFKDDEFSVTYYDPEVGANQTKTFYKGDRKAPVKIWTVGQKRYSQYAFDIIEV